MNNFYMDCNGLIYLPDGVDKPDTIWTESKEGNVTSSSLRKAKYVQLKNRMWLVLIEMVDMMDGEEYFTPVKWNNSRSAFEVGETTKWFYTILNENEISI